MFETPVAKTANVRPPTSSAPRCAAESMPRAKSTDDGQPRACQRFGQTLGLLLAVQRAAARSDDGDSQLVARLDSAADIQHFRRVTNLREHAGIAIVAAKQQIDAFLAA